MKNPTLFPRIFPAFLFSLVIAFNSHAQVTPPPYPPDPNMNNQVGDGGTPQQCFDVGGEYWSEYNYIANGSFNDALNPPQGYTYPSSQFAYTINSRWTPVTTYEDGNYDHPRGLVYPFGDASGIHFWDYEVKWYPSTESYDNFNSGGFTGKFYGGFIQVDLYAKGNASSDKRNYVVFPLVKPLMVGAQYYFEIEIEALHKLADSMNLRLDNIGVYFTDSLPPETQDTSANHSHPKTPVLNYTPKFRTPVNMQVSDTSYILNGYLTGNNERYMILGVFAPLFDSIHFNTTPADTAVASYFFDNVKLFRPNCKYPTLEPFCFYYNYGSWYKGQESFNLPLSKEIYTTLCPGANQIFYFSGIQDSVFNWSKDGLPQPHADTINLAGGRTNHYYTFSVDMGGACFDTMQAVILSEYVNIKLPVDSFLFCNDSLNLNPEYVFVNSNNTSNFSNIEWKGLDNNFDSYGNSSLAVTLTDTGKYRLTLMYSSCYDTATTVIYPRRDVLGQPYLLKETSPEHCNYLKDGYIRYHKVNYPDSLYFSWYNSAVGDTAWLQGLSHGTYELRLYDKDGRCSIVTDTVPLNSDSCSSVSGFVIIDKNYNCRLDSNDIRLRNAKVTATPSGATTFTDTTGYFTMQLPSGTYEFNSFYSDTSLHKGCNDSIKLTLTHAGLIKDSLLFTDTMTRVIHNLTLSVFYASKIVLGGYGEIVFSVKNNGDTTESGTAKLFCNNSNVTLQTVYVPSFTGYSGDTAVFSFAPLLPQQSAFISVPYYTPFISSLIGDSVLFAASCGTKGTIDKYPGDNSVLYYAYICSSFDPNEKLVSPPGDYNYHHTDTSERKFTYSINFQNTGNYYATQVLIKDTLSSNYDMSSFQFLTSSHNVETYLINNELSFFFPSIMLPDSGTSQQESRGYAQYSIKAKSSVTIGDTLKNRASIYFDSNPPVITPFATNIYYKQFSTSVKNVQQGDADSYPHLILSPNPFNQSVQLSLQDVKTYPVLYQVEDLGGRLIKEGSIDNNNSSLNLSSLAAATYIIRFKLDGAWYEKKLVKQ